MERGNVWYRGEWVPAIKTNNGVFITDETGKMYALGVMEANTFRPEELGTPKIASVDAWDYDSETQMLTIEVSGSGTMRYQDEPDYRRHVSHREKDYPGKMR